MTITRYQPGGHLLKVNCDDFKFKEIALYILDGYERMFTFKQLSEDVCRELDAKNNFDKDQDVIYEGGFKLNQNDSDRLQKIVWELIWEHKLMIDLLNDSYDYTPDRESVRLLKTSINEE